LPESIRVLVLKSAPPQQIAGFAQASRPNLVVPANAIFDVAEMCVRAVPVRHLFSDGRGAGTLLLCAIFTLNLLEIFFVQSWLTGLTHAAGLPIETAVTIRTAPQVGGVVVAFLVGLLIDRFGPYWVLGTLYGLGTIFCRCHRPGRKFSSGSDGPEFRRRILRDGRANQRNSLVGDFRRLCVPPESAGPWELGASEPSSDH
jgi:hypothetical protein